MKKRSCIILAAAMVLMMSFSAFAGVWKNDAKGWWYENADGSYLRNGWNWVDGNNDGVAECYYFDQEGWALLSTTTPDGYTVDENGAWVVDGEVQTKDVEVKASPKTTTVKKKQRKNGVIKEYKVHASGSSTGVAPKQGEVNGADFNTEHPADNSKN